MMTDTPPINDARVSAALVVASVLGGRSLKSVIDTAERRIADPRDRALLHAIVLSAIRGMFRWRAILGTLLDTPLPPRARKVEAALITALAQMDAMDMPAHAVVDQTVNAIRRLGFASHAALANAVLRRWLRERASIDAAIGKDPEVEHNHPRWLIDRIRTDWPDDWRSIITAANQPAPLWLRINTRRIDIDDYRQQLADQQIAAHVHPTLSEALRLEVPVPIRQLPGFAEGWVSVQDGAAQYAAHLLAPRPGDRVLDACAAPGGKTAHLLERTPMLGELVAIDQDAQRLKQVEANLERLGSSATLQSGDAGDPSAWWDGRPFDRILLDAPCSATGILRRQPDVRLHRRPGDIESTARQQIRLLEALWPLLAPGGRLLYAVCSVLRAESDAVLTRFLASREDANVLPLDVQEGQALQHGVQILPGAQGMDGFAYALLGKR